MANVKTDLMNLGMSPELSNYLGAIIGQGDSDEWIYTVYPYTIHSGTSDASDTSSISIGGGGGSGATRGGGMFLYGNEHASLPAVAILQSGSASGGYVWIQSNASNGQIVFTTNSLDRWSFDSNGDLVQNASNGRNIYLSKAGTAVRESLQTGITAAGTIITDATDLTSVHSIVTTTAASTGVQLWDAPIGAMLTVVNRGANTLKVYPSSGSDAINTLGAGNPASLTAGLGGIFIRNAAATWAAISGGAL